MTILNEEYYQTLWEKFKKTKNLNDFNNKTSALSTKLILDHYKKNKSIHINLQNSKETIFEIGKLLFIELANDIYLNHYDLPNIETVKEFKSKKQFHIGKAKPRKLRFTVKQKLDGNFRLSNKKFSLTITKTYDELIKEFIPISQNARDITLKRYIEFFKKLNYRLKIEFTPFYFDKKVVFISKRSLWDCLPNKNKIPCAYLPNPREEKDVAEMKSIPALQDCLAYFTPKYEVCFQKLLSKDIKIKTIILFDTEADKIEQILQDKARFGFNLIILSNSFSPIKNEAIPCWNWFKEEIEIVEAL